MHGLESEYKAGLIVSIGFHSALLLLLGLNLNLNFSNFEKPVVYSVSIEPGKKLGGISQVPKKNADKVVAPPKKVSAPKPVQTKNKVVTKPKVEKKVEPKKTVKVEPKKAAKTVKKADPKPKAAPKPQPKQEASSSDDYQKAMQRYQGESSKAGGSGFGAAALGGRGMGGGVVRPPEFFQYRDLIEAKVKENWRWFDPSMPLVVQVVFRIQANGTIEGISVVTSSGNREFDDSVYRAVVKANPLPPPPASVANFFREVRMTFDPRD